MANSLLDFVMSLLRDPDAAARYADDPAQAIADAHLVDVTSVDVQNLIPVVSESLSMTTPTHGLDAFGADPAGNVWSSGAATAAFDAFADHLPQQVVTDTHAAVPEVVVDDDQVFDVLTTADQLDPVASLQFDEPLVEEPSEVIIATDAGMSDDWAAPVSEPHPGDHTPGFDVFD
ncbi:IniB N-terminal domain-containing protein [Mycolicibacterium sp. CR10]|uniref:Rv0340 family IniB-related protein n=1 Tax=Mycolicibacterium sp. CR10 TaxID=2562314 RepID=UPI0010C12747|nr:IniB N-terminal domain-containing protein [Mycolicibacterium sp. CR10]